MPNHTAFALARRRLKEAELAGQDFLLITALPVGGFYSYGKGPYVSHTYVATRVDKAMWKDLKAIKRYEREHPR